MALLGFHYQIGRFDGCKIACAQLSFPPTEPVSIYIIRRCPKTMMQVPQLVIGSLLIQQRPPHKPTLPVRAAKLVSILLDFRCAGQKRQPFCNWNKVGIKATATNPQDLVAKMPGYVDCFNLAS